MVATAAIRNLIREGKVHQIASVMQSGAKYGMQTMDQSLASLVKRGLVRRSLAMERSQRPVRTPMDMVFISPPPPRW